MIAAVIMRAGYATTESVTLAVTMVQVGIRRYDGRYFWPYIKEELGLVHSIKMQQLLGNSFINTLRKHGKYITDAVQASFKK